MEQTHPAALSYTTRTYAYIFIQPYINDNDIATMKEAWMSPDAALELHTSPLRFAITYKLMHFGEDVR